MTDNKGKTVYEFNIYEDNDLDLKWRGQVTAEDHEHAAAQFLNAAQETADKRFLILDKVELVGPFYTNDAGTVLQEIEVKV
jgi:hypothetical protein